MAVSTAHMPISELMGKVTRGELRLPEIQRGYVWKPPQIAGLLDSLYREYPSGSLLLWEAEEDPETRAMRTEAGAQPAAQAPLYLLDGQQRLTSLHRVFTGHEHADIVFNIETEAFQNQSAATKRDPRWLRVHDLLRGAQVFQMVGAVRQALPGLDEETTYSRITQVTRIKDYRYYLETLRQLSYADVTDIFVRVNSRGRTLRNTDLALATLSARWPGVLAKFEAEASRWAEAKYPDIDTGFLTRAMTAALLGRGLSQWSLGRLTAASDEQLETAWATVRRGLTHLVPLLKNNLGVQHSSLLPSVLVLVPLVVLLGERLDAAMSKAESNALLYWLLAATVRNRYSGSTDTVMSQDIPAVRKADGLRALYDNLGLLGSRVTVSPSDLAGRGQGSPYFFLSFLVAKRAGATDWWFGSQIDATAEGSQKLQYHHIHPRATLKARFSKQEINDLANLAFISGKANGKIFDRSPADYFPELESLGDGSLEHHFVPLDKSLRTVDAYLEFVQRRRLLLADAMTGLLDSLAPDYVGTHQAADPLIGLTLELDLYQSPWDEPKLLVTATTPEARWQAVLASDALEGALDEAAQGVISDLVLAGINGTVRPADNGIEVELGPFIVEGSREEWIAVLERERSDALPLSQLPLVHAEDWMGERVRFPVTSSD